MSQTAQTLNAPAPPAVLNLGEQIARDARTRLVAAGSVVLVHSTYPQGSPVLEAMSPAAQGAAAALYTVTVTFPVHAFILLSFLSLAPRLDANVGPARLLRTAVTRLVPAHLFWVTAFLGVRALLERRIPEGGEVISGVLLGTAAAHLYFTPVLVLLTAFSGVWGWMAKNPLRAITSAALISVLATSLQLLDGSRSSNPYLVMAMAPFAIAGIAFSRSWRGVAPAQARRTITIAAILVAVGAVTLATEALHHGAERLPFTASLWLSRLALALGVPVLLLAIPGTLPMRWIRLAPYTLGVYFLHPLPIKALQLVQSRIPALEGLQAALILPNAVAATAISLGVVMLLSRTPLRRVVL